MYVPTTTQLLMDAALKKAAEVKQAVTDAVDWAWKEFRDKLSGDADALARGNGITDANELNAIQHSYVSAQMAHRFGMARGRPALTRINDRAQLRGRGQHRAAFIGA